MGLHVREALTLSVQFLSKYTLALMQACNMLKSSRCAIALRARGKTLGQRMSDFAELGLF